MRDVQRSLASLPAVVGVELEPSLRYRAIVYARPDDPPARSELARAVRRLGYVPTFVTE